MLWLGAVIATNLLVSMTVTILVFVSVLNVHVPESFERLVTFVTFPLNSCLNPVIYTLTTSAFVAQLKIIKFLSQCKLICFELCRLLKVAVEGAVKKLIA